MLQQKKTFEKTIKRSEKKKKKKKLLTKQHFSKKEYTRQHQIKNHAKPGNSQSRRLKNPSSTMKTTISSIQKNQEKNVSHIRRLSISHPRHLKTGSLILGPPEGISQSRHLHHFPNPSPTPFSSRHFSALLHYHKI